MILSIDDARDLAERCMVAVGHTLEEAEIIADHLIDCELRGLSYGGLARAVSITERIQATGTERKPFQVVKDTPVSATIDGGDQVGYLVARKATELAIEKARATGIALIGAYETWYTGMFSYYLEAITGSGFMGLIAGSGTNIVAPHGGTQGRFATNPIAFGFPSTDQPVIWDIGTTSITLAEVLLAVRLEERLPEGRAYDSDGAPTTDPLSALTGAFAVWGGHKGSGLAVVVQLLGMLAGAAMAPDPLRDSGLFLLVIDPDILGTGDDFAPRVAEYASLLRSTRPVDPDQPVRVPFERSAAERERRRAEGTIEVDDTIHAQLQTMVNPQ